MNLNITNLNGVHHVTHIRETLHQYETFHFYSIELKMSDGTCLAFSCNHALPPVHSNTINHQAEGVL